MVGWTEDVSDDALQYRLVLCLQFAQALVEDCLDEDEALSLLWCINLAVLVYA